MTDRRVNDRRTQNNDRRKAMRKLLRSSINLTERRLKELDNPNATKAFEDLLTAIRYQNPTGVGEQEEKKPHDGTLLYASYEMGYNDPSTKSLLMTYHQNEAWMIGYNDRKTGRAFRSLENFLARFSSRTTD